jgi:hypothetical protein
LALNSTQLFHRLMPFFANLGQLWSTPFDKASWVGLSETIRIRRAVSGRKHSREHDSALCSPLPH